MFQIVLFHHMLDRGVGG